MLAGWLVVLGLGVAPQICRDAAPSGNAWERAKFGQLLQYCAMIAQGDAQLAQGPAEARAALALGRRASLLQPAQGAAFGLIALAQARLGDDAAATATLSEHPDATGEVAVVLLQARLAAKQRRREIALQLYGQVIVRARDLSSTERAAAMFELGWLHMLRGPEGLEDARTLFAEVERAGGELARPAELSSALAASRAGEELAALPGAAPTGASAASGTSAVNAISDAGSMRGMHGGAASGANRARSAEPAAWESGNADSVTDWSSAASASLNIVQAQAERDAVEALARDRVRRGSGKAYWERYVATAGDAAPWLQHARAHALPTVPRK